MKQPSILATLESETIPLTFCDSKADSTDSLSAHCDSIIFLKSRPLDCFVALALLVRLAKTVRNNSIDYMDSTRLRESHS